MRRKKTAFGELLASGKMLKGFKLLMCQCFLNENKIHFVSKYK